MLPNIMPLTLPQQDRPVGAVRYPPWMDPLYLLRTTDVNTRRLTIPGGAAGLTIEANSRRWAIGFARTSGAASDAQLWPLTGVTTGTWVDFSVSRVVFFTLFDYGVLVPRQWFLFSPIGTTLVLYECVVQQDAPPF